MSSEPYVALSYVWGTVEHEPPAPVQEAVETKIAEAPCTIEDAIVVTKALSDRYL
jgi:hypothetical protein